MTCRLIGSAPLRLVEDPRSDRSASRRQRVNHRDVQIAIDRHGQRTGNRCGGQHQHLRVKPLLQQGLPLEHPKLVLFINHRQTELREPDAFLDQGVRTDHHICFASLDLLQSRDSRLSGPPARQQGDSKPKRRNECPQVVVVLFRQDLRWNHECGLIAGPAGDQHGDERDHGFSASHIPLEQTVHRAG